MRVIAAQRNIRIDQTSHNTSESLIQETDMFVKLVTSLLQKSLSLQITNVLRKRMIWNKSRQVYFTKR